MNFDYVLVFLLANLLELPIFILAYWYSAASCDERAVASYPALFASTGRMRLAKIAGLVTLCNLVTHPIVFFGFLASGRTYLNALFLAQLFSIFAEAALQAWAARLPWRQTLKASVFANLFSWQSGALLTYWLFY